MTHKKRISPRSGPPDFSPAASSSSDKNTSKSNHLHKIDKHNNYVDDDDDFSESPYEEEEEEVVDDDHERERLVIYNNNAYSDTESKVPSNNEPAGVSDQFSSPSPSPPLQSELHFSNANLVSSNFYYMNVAPLPIFSGTFDECPLTHLTRFVKVCRANNVPSSSIDTLMKIFPVTLENEAALWYDLNIEPYYNSLSWDEIKSSFLEAYQKNTNFDDDRFRKEVMKINQGDKETVRSYYLRFQWMLKKWSGHEFSDGILKGIFVDGLREDFQDWMMIQKPDSLDEALRLAFNWEQMVSIRAARRKNETKKCGFCDGDHKEERCEVRERMRELWISLKEKKLTRESVGDGDGDGDGEDDEKEEEEKGGELILGGGDGGVGCSGGGGGRRPKKSQCQCWKHQCWKKKLERNNSSLSNAN